MDNGDNGGSTANVFGYIEYRNFLRDWYARAKLQRHAVSYRAFAKKAGFKTSNFLMLVMQGKRNLTEESLKKVATGIGLNGQEGEFFRNLVFFNQAKTHDEKNSYYQRLVQSRKFVSLKPIERDRYEYYSAWYHPVVRELAVSKDWDGTPEWIARRLNPAITPSQAARSVSLLEKLGFIARNGDGRFKQADAIVTTGPEVRSVVVHNYHKILLDLSKAVMDRLSLEHRDASSLTLGVSRKRIAEIRRRIREFRQDILKLAAGDTEPEEVVLLNIQFYPVTRPAAGSSSAHVRMATNTEET